MDATSASLIPPPSSLIFPGGSPTFSQQEIAVPCVVERFIEAIDSDQQLRCFVESPAFHLGARQKVNRVQCLDVLVALLNGGLKSRRRRGEIPALIRTERLAVVVGRATGRR